MSHILVPRRPSLECGASFVDLHRNAIGTFPTSPKPGTSRLERTSVRPEIAASLAKRFGYPIEFLLNLGRRQPMTDRWVEASKSYPNGLILSGNVRQR
jgi:hypothetical protein